MSIYDPCRELSKNMLFKHTVSDPSDQKPTFFFSTYIETCKQEKNTKKKKIPLFIMRSIGSDSPVLNS